MERRRSEEQMIEAAQPDGLPAGEGFGVSDAGHVAPEAGAVADRVDDAGRALGLVVDELRAIAAERGDLGVELVGDVEHEARALDDLEVDAEIIEDSRGMEGPAREVGLAQL